MRGDDDGVDKQKLAPETRAARRPYSKPKVQEYGSIAKLTQSGGSTKPEGGSKKSGGCL